MKSVLIFSACLVLVLLLRGMPKTDIRVFDQQANLQQVDIGVSILRTCFANSLISGVDENLSYERLNLIISSLMLPVTTSDSPQFSGLFYVSQIIGWAIWIGLSYRRQRPYRNPLRRFRLNKKQRRRLLKHLLTLSAAQNYGPSSSSSSMEEV